MIKYFLPLLTFFIVVLLWGLATYSGYVPGFILPPPDMFFREFFSQFSNISKDFSITSIAAIAGFMIANCASLLIALLFHVNRKTELALMPYLIALKSTPIVALTPLIVIWFGFGISSKIAMASVAAFFPLVLNLTIGLRSVPKYLTEVAQIFGASKWDEFRLIRFPFALPYVFSALRISATMAVIGAVIAEMMGGSSGLGYSITVTSYTHNTALLFCYVFASAVLGIAMFFLIVVFERLIGMKHWADAKST